jgi:hypothetical protein
MNLMLRSLTFVVVLLAAGGCAGRAPYQQSVALPPKLNPETAVGSLLASRPDIVEHVGAHKSIDMFLRGHSSYSKAIPFFGVTKGRVRERWLHRIVGAKGALVVEVELVRLNRGPWNWEVKEMVDEKEFLARYMESPASPMETAMDAAALKALLDDKLVVTAAGTVRKVQALQPLRLAKHANVDYDAFFDSIPAKNGARRRTRDYVIEGPDGTITVTIRFESAKPGDPWMVSNNGIVPRDDDHPANRHFPEPSRLDIYTAP